MNPSSPISSRLAAVRDHNRVFAEYLYVYPVISRRSRGLSLGVNLNPDKRCNFDCIYCEVDRRTPPRTTRLDVRRLHDELLDLVRRVKNGELLAMQRFSEAPELASEIKDIAFSGDGEPTMIPNFCECVEAVVEVKVEEKLSNTKLVLITDAAGLDKADVRRGLALMDKHQGEIWGKLDAGTDAYYRLVNRSHVQFGRILKNLLETAHVRPIVIQSLFLRVHGQSMPAEELEAYCVRLNELLQQGGQIKEVHAYTVARPTPEPYATALAPEELEGMAEVIRQRTGLPVHTFA